VADQFQTTCRGPRLEGAGLGNHGATYAKGFISDPKSKAKSVELSEEGEKLSKELFAKHFSLKS
jgi:hypothetical protein